MTSPLLCFLTSLCVVFGASATAPAGSGLVAAVEFPADRSEIDLRWGLKRDGRLLAEGRRRIAPVPPEATQISLEAPAGTDGPAVLHLCINLDKLDSYVPSFGDAYQHVPIELKGGTGRVAVPRRGWQTRTLSSPANRVTIHYHRFEGDYQAVGLWTWDEKLQRAPKANELFEVGRDGYGLIFELDTADYGQPGERIGLLPRMNGDWSFKDGGDRFWSPDLGGQVFLVQDSNKLYTSPPDVSPRLLGATIDGLREITLRFTHTLPPPAANTLVILDRTGSHVPAAWVRPAGPRTAGRCAAYVVTAGAALDLARQPFVVELRIADSGLRIAEGWHGPQPPGREFTPGHAAVVARLGRVLGGDPFVDLAARLGANCSPDRTLFGVFSPTAEAVETVVATTAAGGEVAVHPMTRSAHGVWSVAIEGDLHGRFHAYRVRGTGDESEVNDMAAMGAQGPGRRAMILDPKRSRPPRFSPAAHIKQASPADAVVYEMHVRDFTVAANSGVLSKGKYLGLTESGTHLPDDPSIKTGLDHLVELGVTHVQLLPVQDFEGPDDRYNWGYMTVFFNSPEGAYATTPEGDARVRELKQAVQAFHDRGIGVILDVVYNHTSSQASFERIAPGYYFRQREDGSFWNGSGCGNEVRTEYPMVRKFIVDSLKYWVNEYGIDGFRFDLMGLMDLETLQAIRDELRRIHPSILLYGEPWTGGSSGIARVTDQSVIRGTGIGAFNDHFRDAIKGDRNDGPPGFIQAGDRIDGIRNGLAGAIRDWAQDPTDAVTYGEAHDNLTTWDKLLQSVPDAPDGMRRRMQRFAGLLVLTSQGMPFLHAGQEFCRTKGGSHNSYNAGDAVNQIDWSLKKTNRDVFDYYRGLMALRKARPAFRLRTRQDVERRLHILDEVPSPRCVAYRLDSRGLPGESISAVLVLLNGEATDVTFQLPAGQWKIVADADRAGTAVFAEAVGTVPVVAHSGMVLVE